MIIAAAEPSREPCSRAPAMSPKPKSGDEEAAAPRYSRLVLVQRAIPRDFETAAVVLCCTCKPRHGQDGQRHFRSRLPGDEWLIKLLADQPVVGLIIGPR
jgi:hypothetical protein